MSRPSTLLDSTSACPFQRLRHKATCSAWILTRSGKPGPTGHQRAKVSTSTLHQMQDSRYSSSDMQPSAPFRHMAQDCQRHSQRGSWCFSRRCLVVEVLGSPMGMCGMAPPRYGETSIQHARHCLHEPRSMPIEPSRRASVVDAGTTQSTELTPVLACVPSAFFDRAPLSTRFWHNREVVHVNQTCIHGQHYYR